jgi:hypothetical protein
MAGVHMGAQSALTSPAEGDKIPIYDISESVGRVVTVLNLMKVLQSALTSYAIHADNLPDLTTAQLATAAKTGSDTKVVTGTEGTDGNLAEWNSDGDLVDGPTPPTGTIVGTTDTQTLTNKTIDGDDNTLQDIPYSAIKSTSRTGDDTKLVTGTEGSNGNLASWNADGDLVDSGTSATVLMPAGAVLPFAMETPPTGWLECDGSAVSRSTYSGLFAAIGEVFGVGDSSTTFNLPDLRGQFIRGWDHGAATDPNAATRTDSGDGSTTGDHVGTNQADGFKAHTHTAGIDQGEFGSANEETGSKGTNSG